MKTRVLITCIVVLSSIILIPQAFAMCGYNEDWPKAPCHDAGESIEQRQEDWKPYHDYKGNEWMNEKRKELIKVIIADTLDEWLDKTFDSSHWNVYKYYSLFEDLESYKKSPLKQIKSGIKWHNVECHNDLELVYKKGEEKSACVTLDTKIELTVRGWADDMRILLGCTNERYYKCYPEDKNEYRKLLQKYYYETDSEPETKKQQDLSAIEKLLRDNHINYLPDRLVTSRAISFSGDPGCGVVIDADSQTHWFGIDSFSEPKVITLFSENPNMCRVNTSSCFCNVQIGLTALTLEELSYFTPEDEKEFANILIDYLSEENINRTPKFLIGKLNINYTDSSAIGYCGQIWGTNTYGFFSGATVNDIVMDYGIAKELPLLCAISDDAKWWERK